ncbi:MAG: hypothetical protein LUI05_03010 [Oscillospiraceae bacterium]|nr:hypothetical protein [Oscillospiraceae bacterium]
MKYTVRCSCGHNDVVELFGKGADRERKIAWYETSGVCVECYKAAKRAEEAVKPIVATVKVNGNLGKVVIVLSGNVYPKKDDFKARGYFWSADTDDMSDELSGKVVKAWRKTFGVDEKGQENLEKEIETLKAQGVEVKEMINPVDAKLAQDKNAEESAEAEEISKIEKPAEPEMVAGKRWNGNIYGSEKYGYRVYLDNKEIKITEEQKEMLEGYISAKSAYNKRVAEVRNRG